MKHLILAKRWKRILAAFMDFLIISGASLILYFTAVYPNYFNSKEYEANRNEIVGLYRESQLFVVSSAGSYAGKSTYTYSTILELSDATLVVGGETFEHNNLWKDLFIYYTQKKVLFTESGNLDIDGYKNSILKVGSSESNIASFDENTYRVTYIDNMLTQKTQDYFLKQYEDASQVVNKSGIISIPTQKNTNILFSTIAMIIPCIAGFAFIFAFLIPLFMPHGETLGKKIFSLSVISKTGYKLSKWLLIPRFLVYLVIEFILGIMTFGGCFLISYTMFMFMKNRRCLHDLLGASVVIDMKGSIFFETPQEEKYYKDHYENKEQ